MGMIIPFLVMLFFDAIQACFPPFIPSPPLPAPTITVETANPNEPLTTSPCKFNWDQVQGTGCLVGCVRYSVMLKQRETIVQKLTTKENTATIPLPSMTTPTSHTFEVQAVAWFGSGVTEVGKLAVTIGAVTPASGSPSPGQNPIQQNGQPPGQQIVGAPVVPPINPQAPQFGQQRPPVFPLPSTNPGSAVPQPPPSSGPSKSTWTASAPIPNKKKKPKAKKEPKGKEDPRKATPKLIVPYPNECTIETDVGQKKLKFEFVKNVIYKARIYTNGASVEHNFIKEGRYFGKSALVCLVDLSVPGSYRIEVVSIDENMEELSDEAKVTITVGELPTASSPECQWDVKKKVPTPTITSPTPSSCRVKEAGEVTIKWVPVYDETANYEYAVNYIDDGDQENLKWTPKRLPPKHSKRQWKWPKPIESSCN